MLKGALVSFASCVHVPAPAGETEKTTREAPPPVVAFNEIVPPTTAPGSESETLGPVESSENDTAAVVLVLPAASVTTARMTVAPSGELVEFQVAE